MSAPVGRTRSSAPRRALALVAAAGLVLAACGGGDDAAPVTDPPATTAAPTTDPPETTTTTEAPPETAPTTTEAAVDPDPDPDPEPGPVGEPELLWSVEYEERIDRVAMHPDGVHVALAGDVAFVHQLADGALVDAVVHPEPGMGFPDDLAYTADGEFLVAGLHVQMVAISDSTGEIVETLPGGNETRVALAAGDTLLAVAERSGEVVVYDLLVDAAAGVFSATERAVLPAPDIDAPSPVTRGVLALDVSPDGTLLVATHNDLIARAWDLGGPELLGEVELDGEGGNTSLLRISPDGSQVAAAVRVDGAQQVRVVDLADPADLVDPDATPIAEFEVLTRVRDLSWSPDGALLAVASRLGTTIWDPVAGELRYTFDETFDATASEQPLSVTFTPDGGHVLITRGTRVAELWRLPGAEELVVPERIVCEPIPIPGDVLFDTGSAELRAEAEPVLAELAAELADTYGDVTLTFVGHTDSRGSAEANRALSFDRAASVAAWFEVWAGEAGVDGWELRTDGRGDTDLAVIDVDGDGNFLAGAGQLNRRVEIEIDADICLP